MGALAKMASEKKPDEGARKRRKPDKPLNGSVRVTQEIEEQLEEVAEDLGFYPGELIEQKMGAWLKVESLRVRKEKYEAAKKAAANRE
jgi:hypothetical protein